MSRGLSKQQNNILGLAVAVSRMRNGKPVGYVPRRDPRWRVPVVTGVCPDVTTAIAAHVLGGVGLRRRSWWYRYYVHLETTPVALSTRASLSRAITGLEKRGCLAYRPYVHETERLFGRGHVLTGTGLVIGAEHEPTIPDLDYRLWLIDDNKLADGQKVPAKWFNDDEGAPRFLASPGREHSPPPVVSPPRKEAQSDRVIEAQLSEVAPMSPELSFANRLRALAKLNDPDVLRIGLVEIAAEIEALSAPRALDLDIE